MASPNEIVAYLALFILVGAGFLLVNLLLGYLLRPRNPNPEKLEIYECGEPTIGSSFVQFDLRFYVVALLFIIFDVEVAFFFPWATVFGKATELSAPSAPIVAADEGDFSAPANQLSEFAIHKFRELGINRLESPNLTDEEAARLEISTDVRARTTVATQRLASKIAWTSLADIGVFFAVLMVGFAYVWKRGDLDWVRAVTHKASTTTTISADEATAVRRSA
ncbi:NADH-quinone oxidoreductase subunit A [Aeoliella sp. ICT_H6.2]|uniref:NADH-quinone oxidoreductase subunit A n=1 Tax=Aeoliella straminimaris TaxID=2954799 RepID=A0A9X2FDB1_9BACT|nr:NADH-quinone oxidoreductase subunit A [Aeoliella straminimaris]MCO6044209.1 NADH-quinone oxidoreductase subunit A [Aeoliella straminimaris]